MKKVILIFIFPVLVCISNTANESYSNIIWVTPKEGKSLQKILDKTSLGYFFDSYNVTNYQLALPWSKNPELQNIYQITCKNSIDAKKMINKLENEFVNFFPIIRHIHEPISLGAYDPSDYMWNNHPDWVWHLKIIDADKAWYITKGSSDIKIAVIDTWFDINHPDLEYKFTTTSDPMSGTTFSSDCKRNHHGTAVSSFAAAHTDGGGQLSSIGFNTMIKPYHWVNGLAKAHHASIVEGVDVISISWFSSCSPDTTGQDQLIIQEILDNGTTIVASAGNGYTGASCPIGGEPPFSPLYPFSPTYDDRLICVTSTDENDNHTFYMNGENKTHSHYPEVDICAPGYSVMGATSTEKEEDNGNCVPNTWPYHGSWSGTSFATPIVAGVAALIKSANNSVTPAQVKDIIKSTADPVNDAHLYPGMLGAGRINAYCAVYQSEPLFLSGSQSGSFERFFVNLDDVIVESGNNLQIKYNEINFTSEFEAELGAELLIEPGSNFSCP